MKRSKATSTAKLWNASASYKAPVRLTQFEKYALNLGLDPDDTEALVVSEELRDYAMGICHDHYVPEVLLSRWKIASAWSEGDKERLPKFSTADARAALTSESA